MALELHLPDPPIGDVELFSIPPPAIPFPTSAPFAAGSAQVGVKKLTDFDMMIANPPTRCKRTTTTTTKTTTTKTAPKTNLKRTGGKTQGGGGTTAKAGDVSAGTAAPPQKAKNCTPRPSTKAQKKKAKKYAESTVIKQTAYGGSPRHTGAWGQLPLGTLAMPFVGAPGPIWTHYSYMVPTVRSTINTSGSKLKSKYKGLPKYSDTVPITAPWGFQAPYFLAGLVMDDVEIYSDTAPLKTVGDGPVITSDNKFYLDDSAIAGGDLGAISKAEVYFSRPLDLAYFGRADGQAEYGSAFNPYWQARLRETTNADRMIALAIQQGQFFSIFNSIGDLISTAGNLTMDLFGLQ